ncbi:MAG TPA: gluconate 2-dehydrogenase subunit 3 family protein [Acidimicrobiales bacterium]|nr:gluconate 2-dehydrogenase subunit 3 family protein [Acidimicrobiales bacterium]
MTTPGNEGRFEGYDIVKQRKHWDEVTRDVVMSRLEAPPPALEFFTEREAQTANALLDLVLAQHSDPKVEVLHLVDKRLAEGSTDGWRYEDMPEDSIAWRESLLYLDQDAQETFGCRFDECSVEQQGQIVQGVQDAKQWYSMPAEHVWSLWTRYACSAFYAHPWAWNEIGFGGPAYPRGYKVLRPGWREPYEVPERDAEDPVPWADKVERAKRSHEVRTGTK